jgi:hypothetical protein
VGNKAFNQRSLKSVETKIGDIHDILETVPDLPVFLTVDELKASSRRLAEQYPDTVQMVPAGVSRQGEAIEALKIGEGAKTALLFAMPHPNEPIGSMMLEVLAAKLAEDEVLREALGYTWILIKCIDPDGTRLNEGWFKGPFSVGHYARNYYRPPAFEQVEWTFPIDYETLHFDAPLPETRALMKLIEEVKPDLIYSLHNSGFGGAYFYISEEAPWLYERFWAVVESQDLPLHLGEPEMPYATTYAKAIYAFPPVSTMYDFLKEQTGKDPAEILKGGTSSIDYAARFCDPFGLVCEMPYFHNASIHDTGPSDMQRRIAILEGTAQARADLEVLRELYAEVVDELTVSSPFRVSIEEYLRTWPDHLDAHENWARTDPETERLATVAEKLDNLVIGRVYRLFSFGMFARLVEAEIADRGETPALAVALNKAEAHFEERSSKLEAELDYSVIPIQKLVRVQLGSALLAAEYAAGR